MRLPLERFDLYCRAFFKRRGRVAQLVEQLTFNQWVEGSNPSAITKKNEFSPRKRAALFPAVQSVGRRFDHGAERSRGA